MLSDETCAPICLWGKSQIALAIYRHSECGRSAMPGVTPCAEMGKAWSGSTIVVAGESEELSPFA